MVGVTAACSSALAVLVLDFIASPAVAQVPFLGRCPDQEVVQDFNTSAFLGKWYEQQRYFAIFELGGNCVTAVYAEADDGSVAVTNTQTNLLTGNNSSMEGVARLVGGESEAKFGVRFSSVNYEAPYWILETDYDNYAIAWSCTNIISISNVQFAWVLTRRKNPMFEVLASVKESLERRRIATMPLRRTLQVCDN